MDLEKPLLHTTTNMSLSDSLSSEPHDHIMMPAQPPPTSPTELPLSINAPSPFQDPQSSSPSFHLGTHDSSVQSSSQQYLSRNLTTQQNCKFSSDHVPDNDFSHYRSPNIPSSPDTESYPSLTNSETMDTTNHTPLNDTTSYIRTPTLHATDTTPDVSLDVSYNLYPSNQQTLTGHQNTMHTQVATPRVPQPTSPNLSLDTSRNLYASTPPTHHNSTHQPSPDLSLDTSRNLYSSQNHATPAFQQYRTNATSSSTDSDSYLSLDASNRMYNSSMILRPQNRNAHQRKYDALENNASTRSLCSIPE